MKVLVKKQQAERGEQEGQMMPTCLPIRREPMGGDTPAGDPDVVCLGGLPAIRSRDFLVRFRRRWIRETIQVLNPWR